MTTLLITIVAIVLALIGTDMLRWRGERALRTLMAEIYADLGTGPRMVRLLYMHHVYPWNRYLIRRALMRLETHGRVVVTGWDTDNPMAALSPRDMLLHELQAAISRIGAKSYDLTVDEVYWEAQRNREFYGLLLRVADEFDRGWRERGSCELYKIPELSAFVAAESTVLLGQRGTLSLLVSRVVLSPPRQARVLPWNGGK